MGIYLNLDVNTLGSYNIIESNDRKTIRMCTNVFFRSQIARTLCPNRLLMQ